MKAYEAIAELLVEEEIDTVFTLLSEEIIPLIGTLHDRCSDAIRIVSVRHEQGATAMADGYARSGDNIGVCIVGRGPAVAQTGTALVTASKRGSRLLFLVSEPKLTADQDVKRFRQEDYLRSVVDHVEPVQSKVRLLPTLKDGFRRLRLGEGPVAVQIPWDLLESEVQLQPSTVDSGSVRSRTRSILQSVVHPDPEPIEQAVEALLDSDATRAPVILAGRGAVRSGAREELEQLAETLNAYLATTLQAHEFFSGHPFNLGLVGDLGSLLANEYLSETDWLYAVGCSLNYHTTDSGNLIRDDARVIHVDADSSSLGRHVPVDVPIHADARQATQRLLDALNRQGIERSGAFWTERAKRKIADHSFLDYQSVSEQPDRFDPRKLVLRLDEMLPEDRLVVHPGGHSTLWVLEGISAFHPDNRIWTLDFQSIGLSLPMGIGAALGTERTCVTFCGDAGFLMSIQELDTAVREEVPMLIFVLNDEALGAEHHYADMLGFPKEISILPTPDLSKLAGALGAEAYTARTNEDLDDLAEIFGNRPSGPVVVDCKLNREVAHRYVR